MKTTMKALFIKHERSSDWPARFSKHHLRMAIIATISLIAVDRPASAIPIGSSEGPGSTTTVVFDDQGYGAWFVADLSDPITPAPIAVSSSSSSGPWRFELGFGSGLPDLQTGAQFVLQELVRIEAGDFSVGGWAQEILSPDWRWIDASIFDNTSSLPLSGLGIQLTDLLVTLSFDPILAGTDVFVVKTLEYIGPGVATATGGLSVATSVYVPEPGVASLLAIGLSIAAIHRFGGNVRHV
ncbi:MAG: hypothetical protein U0900_04080 [Myxococcota bacterium]